MGETSCRALVTAGVLISDSVQCRCKVEIHRIGILFNGFVDGWSRLVGEPARYSDQCCPQELQFLPLSLLLQSLSLRLFPLFAPVAVSSPCLLLLFLSLPLLSLLQSLPLPLFLSPVLVVSVFVPVAVPSPCF